MAVLFAHLTTERARTYSLVLASAGIEHTVDSSAGRKSIHVPSDQRAKTQRAIQLYLIENQDLPEHAKTVKAPQAMSYSAFFAASSLVAIQLAIESQPHPHEFIIAFGADAGQILDGQFFRCSTALLLHSGWPHVLSNAAAAVVFGTFAAIIYGWGLVWLLIMLCGAIGNLLTAWWYGGNHLSIGASTAIFAALGLCVAATFWNHLALRRKSKRAWLPIAGGLALVGWLGTAPQSDLIAHLAGFMVGLLTGTLYHWAIGRVYPWAVQCAALCMVVGLVALSWYWGVRAYP